MSKRVEANITCSDCKIKFKFSLYRTIWGEYPDNRELVMKNKINVATCPNCSKKLRANYPFMYTNADQKFAVWYEPFHDTRIDKDVEGYKMFAGLNDYLTLAPRIKDWETFKNTIIRYENGTLKNT